MTMMMIIGIILLLLSSREALAQPYNSDCNFGSHAFEIGLGRRDVEQSCFEFRGRRKCLYTFIPSNCTDVGKLPLVFDLHDQSGCPVEHAKVSGWLEKAAQECIVVVWPTVSNGNRVGQMQV
jgi:poly(3-hydroxybutyrate) depolymerase